jgi:hypothetical protein
LEYFLETAECTTGREPAEMHGKPHFPQTDEIISVPFAFVRNLEWNADEHIPAGSFHERCNRFDIACHFLVTKGRGRGKN